MDYAKYEAILADSIAKEVGVGASTFRDAGVALATKGRYRKVRDLDHSLSGLYSAGASFLGTRNLSHVARHSGSTLYSTVEQRVAEGAASLIKGTAENPHLQTLGLLELATSGWSRNLQDFIGELEDQGMVNPASLDAIQKARDTGTLRKLWGATDPAEVEGHLREVLSYIEEEEQEQEENSGGDGGGEGDESESPESGDSDASGSDKNQASADQAMQDYAQAKEEEASEESTGGRNFSDQKTGHVNELRGSDHAMPPTGNLNAYKQRVKAMLLDQTQSQRAWAKKGKLGTKRIHRVVMPTVGDGSWNNNIFQRTTEGEAVDAAITILMDVSSSCQWNDQDKEIQKATYHTADLLGCLGVPIRIIAYGSELYGVKGFDEVLSKPRLASRVYKPAVSGGTPIKAACNTAIAGHILRREGRQVVINVTDGDYQDRLVSGCFKDLPVEVAAIFVGAEAAAKVSREGEANVAKHYSAIGVCADPHDLGRTLVDIARELVFNRKP